MVNPKEKKGYRWYGEVLDEGYLTENEGVFENYEEITIYECSECGELYDEIVEAEDCCNDKVEEEN